LGKFFFASSIFSFHNKTLPLNVGSASVAETISKAAILVEGMPVSL